jgi:hypothetical protein
MGKILVTTSVTPARTENLKNLQATKQSTLAGASIAVFSSSLFYINLVLFVGMQGDFLTSIWLNPFVCGANFDSILNDLGVALISRPLRQNPTQITPQPEAQDSTGTRTGSLASAAPHGPGLLEGLLKKFRTLLEERWLKCHRVDQRQLEAAELYCSRMNANANRIAGSTDTD